MTGQAIGFISRLNRDYSRQNILYTVGRTWTPTSLIAKLGMNPRFDKEYLGQALESIFSTRPIETSFSELSGDASTRRYFRVTYRNGAGQKSPQSVMLMQLDQPVEGGEIDFTRLSQFLRGLDLPVPEMFHYDPGRGLIFLEDCGDTTFEDKVKACGAGEKKKLYAEAVKLLFAMQSRGLKHITPACPAYHLRFDAEKLMSEFDFMLEYFVDKMRGRRPAETGLLELRELFRPLCETLAGEEVCFTHRDYHSRNLMVHNGAIKILDFQDARMGPCQYDLASLLKDSYVELEEEMVEDMIELYVGLKEEADGQAVDRAGFRKIFDMMSIQRNLKAVGTFAFQNVTRNNARYLDCIPRTLGYVKATFGRRPELSALRKSLGKIIPELAA